VITTGGATVTAGGVLITAGGATVTAGGVKTAGGMTLDDQGLVITTGGATVTAGGVVVSNGGVTTDEVESTASLNLKSSTGQQITFSIAAVEKMRLSKDGFLGIGMTNPTVELDVNGGVKGTAAYQSSSDRRWKKNIRKLTSSLQKVMNISGVEYEWRKDEFPQKRFPSGMQMGFIAQDIESVVPNVVQTDAEGWKSVPYGLFSPLLVEAIKEQQEQINMQQTQIQQQQQQIDTLEKSLLVQQAQMKNLEEKLNKVLESMSL